MAHTISGLIGASELLQAFSKEHGLPEPLPLKVPLHFLPLGLGQRAWLLSLSGSGDETALSLPDAHADFMYLTVGLMRLLEELSRRGDIAYIETDYFGGSGDQGAVLYRTGTAIYGPERADIGPINEVLKLMGVQKGGSDFDEFDTAGLGRYRSNEDWTKTQARK